MHIIAPVGGRYIMTDWSQYAQWRIQIVLCVSRFRRQLSIHNLQRLTQLAIDSLRLS